MNCTGYDPELAEMLRHMTDKELTEYASKTMSLDSRELVRELARRLNEKNENQ